MYPSNFLQCSCTWKWCTVESRGHYGIEKLWCYRKAQKVINEEMRRSWKLTNFEILTSITDYVIWGGWLTEHIALFKSVPLFCKFFGQFFWQTTHNHYFISCDINNAAYWWVTIFHEVNKKSKILKFPYFYNL